MNEQHPHDWPYCHDAQKGRAPSDQQIIDCFTKAGYWMGINKEETVKQIKAVRFALDQFSTPSDSGSVDTAVLRKLIGKYSMTGSVDALGNLIAHIESLIATQVATTQGMADCMGMVREELIEAGIIDKSVPPMMTNNSEMDALLSIADGYLSSRVVEYPQTEGERACSKALDAVVKARVLAKAQPTPSDSVDTPELSKLIYNVNPDDDETYYALIAHIKSLIASVRKDADQIAHHLAQAHQFIENTEAFGNGATSGILDCGGVRWDIDKSKSALASFNAAMASHSPAASSKEGG